LRNILFIISYIMAVSCSLAILFINDSEKQKMASIMAFLFLLSFFININPSERLFLKIACLVSFTMAILSAIVGIFSRKEFTRVGSIFVGVVSLGVSLLILFSYLEFNPI